MHWRGQIVHQESNTYPAVIVFLDLLGWALLTIIAVVGVVVGRASL